MFSLTKKFPERDGCICRVSIPQMTCVRLMSHRIPGMLQCPASLQSPRCLLTQFEISMQDPLAVEVLETGDDLFKIISHFGLCQRVPRFPNVRQGLQGQSDKEKVSTQNASAGLNSTQTIHTAAPAVPPCVAAQTFWRFPRDSPFDCRAPGICRRFPGLRNNGRISPHACVTAFGAARSHL